MQQIATDATMPRNRPYVFSKILTVAFTDLKDLIADPRRENPVITSIDAFQIRIRIFS
jgi:hypothetical protein